MNKIYEILKKKSAYEYALALINWDRETEAPKLSLNDSIDKIEILSEVNYNLNVSDEFKNSVKDNLKKDDISDIDKRVLFLLNKSIEEIEKIPKELYLELIKQKMITVASWEEGKSKEKYDEYGKNLSKLIKLQKEVLKKVNDKNNMYDKLLDEYEEGLNIEIADKFFDEIREKLVPVISKIINKKDLEFEKEKKEFFSKKYDIEKQKIISIEVAKKLGFDFDKGVLKESEHPFTTTLLKNDIRITTHYYENNPLSSLYSTIHEVGHGIYEQNIDEEVANTYILKTGTSMGIHESQSRFYENLIGKNEKFIEYIYDLYKKYFDIKISKKYFNMLINEVENQFIRTEADELTYPLHILIRYELEKEIFSNEDEVDYNELKEKWNEKYEKYLGIKPDKLSNGIMQDIHWSSGLFGYFPSYAIGSAYASQMLNTINKSNNIDELILKGDFEKIKQILVENIHRYGKLKKPLEILKDMTYEDFNPKYYTNYLIEKYSKLYGI